MKIVILSPWFSEKMGYAENYLPIAFGKLGHEVHLITTDLQVYANSPDYNKIYFKHLGAARVETGIFKQNYYTLHRCEHGDISNIYIKDLELKIKSIKPEVVYLFEILGPDFKKVIELRSKFRFKIFAESRLHLSIFNKPITFRQKLYQKLLAVKGFINSFRINLYYPIAPDVLEVIVTNFGIPNAKCKLSSLAVNTDIFTLSRSFEAELRIRQKFGYDANDIVCLYTGKLIQSKNPLILAKAINYLHSKGYNRFKAHFVGQGPTEYSNLIRKQCGCVISDFVEPSVLASYYQAFDIGVWPSEESTSQLDAAVCGMPIIISENVEDKFRINGNGFQYKHLDFINLSQKLLALADRDVRKAMGLVGHKKISQKYSWNALAQEKISDFLLY